MFSSSESTSYASRKRLTRKVKEQCAQYYDALQSNSNEDQEESLGQLKELYEEARQAAKQSNGPVQTRGVYSSGGD